MAHARPVSIKATLTVFLRMAGALAVAVPTQVAAQENEDGILVPICAGNVTYYVRLDTGDGSPNEPGDHDGSTACHAGCLRDRKKPGEGSSGAP